MGGADYLLILGDHSWWHDWGQYVTLAGAVVAALTFMLRSIAKLMRTGDKLVEIADKFPPAQLGEMKEATLANTDAVGELTGAIRNGFTQNEETHGVLIEKHEELAERIKRNEAAIAEHVRWEEEEKYPVIEQKLIKRRT